MFNILMVTEHRLRELQGAENSAFGEPRRAGVFGTPKEPRRALPALKDTRQQRRIDMRAPVNRSQTTRRARCSHVAFELRLQRWKLPRIQRRRSAKGAKMAESEIGFAQLGLASILRQNQLAVPPNQREFSWTTKEVRTLLQDLAKAISGGDTTYFLGTIVTIPRSGGVLEVVDGQQRLATTAIMLSAIRDYLRAKEPLIAKYLSNSRVPDSY